MRGDYQDGIRVSATTTTFHFFCQAGKSARRGLCQEEIVSHPWSSECERRLPRTPRLYSTLSKKSLHSMASLSVTRSESIPINTLYKKEFFDVPLLTLLPACLGPLSELPAQASSPFQPCLPRLVLSVQNLSWSRIVDRLPRNPS